MYFILSRLLPDIFPQDFVLGYLISITFEIAQLMRCRSMETKHGAY